MYVAPDIFVLGGINTKLNTPYLIIYQDLGFFFLVLMLVLLTLQRKP